MKLKHLFLFCSFFLLFSKSVNASHLLGGEIGYVFVSSTGTTSTYKVVLKFFSDCSSTSAALPLLIGADPRVALYNGANLVSSQNLVYNAALSDVEITPVCPDEVNNTKCTNPNNPLPGIKLYVYESTFTLNATSANWRFQFEGAISLGSNAGRTPLITNADVSFGSSLIYLEATLNNLTGNNSTCTFDAAPTPFFCLNTANTYNLGAQDPDGDAIGYSLIPARESLAINISNPGPITYFPPYTATAPVPSSPGTFSFNGGTGQLNFTPDVAVNSVVVNKVSETRNGVEVGSSMREMAFLILVNCPNQGPSGPVGNIQNGNVDPNEPTMVNACQSASENVSFDIGGQDPEGDNVELSATGLPAGATVNITNNNTPNPTLHFNWNIGGMPVGDYSFFVKMEDDGCPISVSRIIAYTVRVNPTYEIDKNNVKEICSGETYLFYGKHYYATGLYDTVFATVKGCDSIVYLNLLVNPKPDVTLKTFGSGNTVAICEGTTSTLFVRNPQNGATYQWIKDESSLAGETGSELVVNDAGNYWVAAASSKGCVDTSVKIQVSLNPNPVADIVSPGNEVLCAYDTLEIKANGAAGLDYRWEPAKPFRGISGAEGPIVKGIFLEPTLVTLSVYNQFGCVDTATAFINTKPCCEVFVPNAFTPNGDGNNDYFKPMLQNGQILVSMQIFDRWGKRVYDNENIKKGWNGNYPNGDPASTNTYMYYIKYTCADGKLYEKRESLTLMRD